MGRYISQLQEQLAAELGPGLQLRVVGGHHAGAWLRHERTGNLWLGLPMRLHEPRPPYRIVTWLALVAVLTFLGAWLLTRSLTRPLAQLAQATGHIARGEPLPPLPRGGPREARELARALTVAAAEASRLARDRELLLAGVSHDLRTPLARLRMAIELLPESGPGAELRDGMTEDVEEMNAIIGQFLALVREGQEEAVTPVVLDALAREVVEARRREGHDIELSLRAPDAVPARRLALQRALGNLLSNALTHGRAPVCVATGHDGGRFHLAVTDHGPGIAVERLQSLLRPFAAAGGDGRQPGEGLGLAVVERTARLHGGEVRAWNHEGVFEIRLEWPDTGAA
jgi:two-component system osmolarity sensor histidine kinase EnvZ